MKINNFNVQYESNGDLAVFGNIYVEEENNPTNQFYAITFDKRDNSVIGLNVCTKINIEDDEDSDFREMINDIIQKTLNKYEEEYGGYE